jgi:antitoxin MazE
LQFFPQVSLKSGNQSIGATIGTTAVLCCLTNAKFEYPSCEQNRITALAVVSQCIYNVDTLRRWKMLVKIQKWGNSAALRVPAAALKEAGFVIGQRLDLKVKDGMLYLEPAQESLEQLVACITPQNCHGPLLDDEAGALGNEAW